MEGRQAGSGGTVSALPFTAAGKAQQTRQPTASREQGPTLAIGMQRSPRSPGSPRSQGRHSLQGLELRQRALVARQGGGQGIQAVDEEDPLIGGVQMGALIHPAKKENKKESKKLLRGKRNSHCPPLPAGLRLLATRELPSADKRLLLPRAAGLHAPQHCTLTERLPWG